MIDESLAAELKKRAASGDATVLRSPEFRSLFDGLKTLPAEQKAAYGQAVNQLRQELESTLAAKADEAEALPPIDVTAPMDINAPAPVLLPSQDGSRHPLMTERDKILDIFYRMGFNASESREIDDDFHMFGALNFPEGHPARDDYDTFMTEQTDTEGRRLIAPAHTSTMQNRVLKQYKSNLERGEPIAVVVPDRVFRNEDLDARHEHTFYQLEGVYVDKGVHAGMLIATLKTFLQEYYEKELGMIHPNVLRAAGIDPEVYTGFAWGCGIDRLVFMKEGIEDIRNFHSAKLDFLRQFS
jgi:phenylalanyl-tRNA synthetase alpha chain